VMRIVRVTIQTLTLTLTLTTGLALIQIAEVKIARAQKVKALVEAMLSIKSFHAP
jgi:hypothetical protein